MMSQRSDSNLGIRDGSGFDIGAVLQLNQQWAHVTSPLSMGRLEWLVSCAALFRVIETDGSLSAFILAFTSGTAYDSVNYRWFDARGSGFLYVDRVIVSASAQRGGLGDALYRETFDFAREHGISRVVCEVDMEPLNAASDAFHNRWGFTQVGTQRLCDGKHVSLRECPVR